MADQQVRAEPVEHPDKRRRFTLPSAYTILFALIVLMAIATWLVPAGVYDRDEEGAPVPGTYQVEAHPQRILIDSLTAPINGLYGIEDEQGNINYYNTGVLLGCGIGTLGSTLNPFATGIASGFAGIPISEGIIGRIVILLVGLAIGIWFVLRYADRVKRDPAASVIHDMKEDNEARFRATAGEEDAQVLTGKHKVILAVFGLAFLVMMYGVIPREDLGVGLPTLWWWFPEMTASFLLFAVIIGLIGRLGEGRLTDSFIAGARDLLGVALIIGIARGITVVMNNGQITDTVLHWAELALGDVGEAAFSIVMYTLFLPLSFLIPSSSGLATVSMPIMAPLAGFVGVPKDLVVTAYQSASGLMNLFIPHLGGGHGRSGHRPRPLRALPPLGVAAAGHAGCGHGGRARRGSAPVMSCASRSARKVLAPAVTSVNTSRRCRPSSWVLQDLRC